MIQDAIDDEVDRITVSYDSEFGYPTNIEIDPDVNAIDDEYTVTADCAFRHSLTGSSEPDGYPPLWRRADGKVLR